MRVAHVREPEAADVMPFCLRAIPRRGIVKGFIEVEGGSDRYKKTINKMRKFLRVTKEWKHLKFGIFLAYPTYASTQKGKRSYSRWFPEKTFIKEGKKITRGLPNKKLAILVFKKSYDKFEKESLRSREFYRGTPEKVYGMLLCNGKKIDGPRTLWPLK